MRPAGCIRIVARAVIVCAVVIFGGWRGGVRVSASAPSDVVAAAAIPSGVQIPHEAERAVRVVAADIDADGDLDLVANQGSTDLAVWINDGTGRLTRKHAAPASGGMQPLAPSPSVDDRDVEPVATVQVDPPTLQFVLQPARHTPLVEPARGGESAPPLRSASARVRTPRAPPAAARS